MEHVPPPRILRWERIEHEVVGRYSVFTVDRVKLRPPPRQGANGQRDARDFYTLGCSDWCNIVAITPNDEIVLVRQFRFGTDAFSLETPGGVVDAGESPKQAALRELREETGFVAHDAELLGVYDANPALQSNRAHSFVARNVTLGTPGSASAQHFDEYEECEVLLVPCSALPELLDRGIIAHGLIVAAVERYLRLRRDER